ncbi:MAG: hypothetical protein ACREJ3_00955 [Polyangiaceae bacterium]
MPLPFALPQAHGAAGDFWYSAAPMDLRADAILPSPRDRAFRVYRDDLLRLLPFLPNVRGIDVKSRTENGTVVEFVNEWHGGGDIPAAARAVLGDAVLSWTDYASWRNDDFWCDWKTTTHAFTEAVRCSGRTRFVADGPDKTLLEVRGSLDIDATKIRGVPSFLAPKMGRIAEDFLVTKIQTNLAETAKGLATYLASAVNVPNGANA